MLDEDQKQILLKDKGLISALLLVILGDSV
jgi:hypothetical protein